METFLFFDYETDGQEPMFCRPFQFACVRTDSSLNPLGPDHEQTLWCTPPHDRLPSLGACEVTGITPQRARTLGTTESIFFRTIHRLVNAPETVSVGWNSLRYDDLVSRFGFWRTFQDPYRHGYADGCRAWDLIDLARAAYALRPEGLTWPLGDNGKPTFKLDRLAPANGIEHEEAHDALADVRASISLGQLIRTRQPRLWDWARSLTETAEVESLLSADEPLVHVSSRFPAEHGCLSVVRVLGRHPLDKRGYLCWDLRHDPQAFIEASTEEMRRRIFTSVTDLPPGQDRFAVKQIKSNRSPFIAPTGVLVDSDPDRLHLDEARWRRHDDLLTRSPAIGNRVMQNLREVFGSRPPASEDASDALYDGFLGGDDQRLRDSVAQTEPADLARLGDRFRDRRLGELMFHYRARNHPDTLSPEERQEWKDRCRQRILAPPGRHDLPWETWRQQVLRASEDVQADPTQRSLASEVLAWGDSVADDCGLNRT